VGIIGVRGFSLGVPLTRRSASTMVITD
jgi:hypothetical protein